jgi:hypothetical protein
MRTACVSIFTAQSDPDRNERLQRLRFLASPVAIVNTGTAVELWAIRRDTEPTKLGQADSRQWQVGLRSRIQELSPESLLLSKFGGYQLDFVDAGLIEWAERITEQTLTTLIEDVLRIALSQTLNTGKESLQPKNQSFRQSVLMLVFQLFACRVLEDKGVIDLHETPEASLRAANNRFSNNIDPDILLSPDLNPTLISIVFEQLRTRFAFASLTTEMLGHVYENALVTPELRRENGIYYTPRIITSYILNRLPVESLPHESRVLVDPCCGSGSFLLAGFDRLTALLPTDWTSARKHQYLRARLIGMDTDEFAVETAVLSLVVRDPLNRNGWQVLRRDVQDLQPPSSGPRPTIIVTNPPFKEIKEGGTRKEFAAEVLIRAIETLAPGGLMGIVLPQSILDSRAGSEARGEARRRCDILEIVTLPGGLFYSNADTAVLVMRKKTARGALSSFSPSVVTVRELHSQDLPRFRSGAGFTATYSVEVEKLGTDAEHRFILSPLAPLWERLEGKCRRLDDIATIRSGLQINKTDSQSVSERQRKGDVEFVNRLDVLRPYALLLGIGAHKRLWLRYGQQLRRMADQQLFDSSKVLLSSNRNPGTAWRLVAAPAPPGLYFSDNFHGLTPKPDGPSVYVITAILNGPLANAWFHAHNRKRKIVHGALGELPIPNIDAPTAKDIERIARRLEKAVVASARQADEGLFYDGSIDSTAVSTLVVELDDVICNAYLLSSSERRALDLFMANERRPV